MIRSNPEEVQITGSCRLVPMVTKEVYEKWVARFRERCESIGATFKVLDYKPPYFSAQKDEVGSMCQRIAKEMGLNSFVAAKTASDANVFMRFGVESLVFGAGQSVGHSLTANEHISMKDLDKALEFYRRVIGQICT
jgi:succinyl-diaminopimelate desuccinylase